MEVLPIHLCDVGVVQCFCSGWYHFIFSLTHYSCSVDCAEKCVVLLGFSQQSEVHV